MGGEPAVGRRGAAPAVPRGARERRQPPRHPRQRVGGPAAPVRRRGPGAAARRRCSAPALDNALRAGDAALTGPVARGDAGTVAAHIERAARGVAGGAAAYVAMARLTADRALAAGLLKPDGGRAPCSTCWPEDRDDHAAARAHRARSSRGATRRAAAARSVSCMTMGALHDGHRELIQVARAPVPRSSWSRSSSTRCSSRRARTSSRYPRTLDADLALCARGGRRPGVRAVGRRRSTRRRSRRCGSRRAAGRRARGRVPARATSTACSPWWPSCCT